MADGDQPIIFAGKPIRSQDTFGVAGFLAEKSKVFYCSIFTTRHLGRVTDLIAARLLSEGLDELRLRALLLFGTFEVFRAQEGATENTSQQRLVEPLVVECGLDEDRVAIGISFTTETTRFPDFKGLAERVLSKSPDNVFERLLVEIHAHSHATFVRNQVAIRRVEIVALIGIPGKADAGAFEGVPQFRVIEIAQAQSSEPPKVNAYVELGDLDYPELLKEESVAGSLAPPATGEVLVHGLKELDDAVKIRAAQLLEAIAVKVEGRAESKDDVIRIKGEASDSKGGSFKVTAGGAIQAARDYNVRNEGGTIAAPAAAETEVESAVEPAKSSAPTDDSGGRLQEVINKVKRVWPFRFGKKSVDETPALKAAEEFVAEPKPEVEVESAKEAPKVDDAAVTAVLPSAKPVVISADDIAKEAMKLTHEIESGIEKTVARAQSEAGELKKEMGSNRAKRWVDGLMSELVAEKARLAEASKALNASIKQKEIEFRTKEQSLSEELRKRDDLIRQKTNAMNRLKDQVAQASLSAEKLKSAKVNSGEDAHYKQKYGMTQKMLASAKEENAALAEKVADMKNQLMNAQLNGAKRSGGSGADFAALQSKYERSIRQADEFKKANQQLLDKLAEAKKDRITNSTEDTKKRLEAAMKMATASQRDTEKLQSKVEDMMREQMRLKAELAKAQQDVKSARAGKLSTAAKPAQPSVAAKPAQAAAAKPAQARVAKPVAPTPKPPGSGGQGTPPKAA